MGWKKLFVGEKMPDKDDPKYKQRYESEVNAGRKFARMMKLDVLAGRQELILHKHYNKGNQKSKRLHEVLSTVNDESNNNNVNIKNDGRTEEH